MRLIIKYPKDIRVVVSEAAPISPIPPKPAGVAGSSASASPDTLKKMQQEVQTSIKRGEEKNTAEINKERQETADEIEDLKTGLAAVVGVKKPGGLSPSDLNKAVKNINNPTTVSNKPPQDTIPAQKQLSTARKNINRNIKDVGKYYKFLGMALHQDPNFDKTGPGQNQVQSPPKTNNDIPSSKNLTAGKKALMHLSKVLGTGNVTQNKRPIANG